MSLLRQHYVLNPLLYALNLNNGTERMLFAEYQGLARTIELQGIRVGALCGGKGVGQALRKCWSFWFERNWTKPLVEAYKTCASCV